MPEWIVKYGSNLGFAGTIFAAIFAGCIAWWAIYTQRDIARKRATLDFFLKTETDSHLLDLWSKYEAALKVLSTSIPATFKQTHSSEYQNIRNYLNVFELFACGVHSNLLDGGVAKTYFRPTVVDGYFKTRELIHEINQEFASESAYCDFVRLAKRWQGNA